MFGMDKLASAYLAQAIDMAHELGLFESTTYIMHKKLRHSYDLTAWPLFHWQCTLSLQFQTAPLLRTPPHSPLPDPDLNADWYSEIWLKYPSTSVLVPMQYRYTFKARVEFSLILNEAMLQASTNEGDNQVVQSGARRIVETVEKLEAWYHTLPDPLLPSNIVFPSQLKLHLHYCYVLIQLYEILTSYENNGSQPLLLDQDELRKSLTHYRASFETILRIHYLRHSFEYGNMMLTQFLALLAFLALNKLDSPMARDSSEQKVPGTDVEDTDIRAAKAALPIAQKGLSDQGRGYYLPKSVFQDVLSHMTPSDSDTLQSFITIQQEGPEVTKERKIRMESHCPPDIIHIANNLDRQLHDNWIHRFAKLTIDKESGSSILDMVFGCKDGEASLPLHGYFIVSCSGHVFPDRELSRQGAFESAAATTLELSDTDEEVQAGPSLPRLLSRANVTKIACEPCRKRKAKCCGERPKCKACINKGLECHYQASSRDLPVLKRKYNEIQEKVNIYERLYDLLMNVPEQDSHAILGKLREGPDVATTILQVDDGDLLLQLASASETRLCKGQAVENLSNWLRGVLPSRGGGLSALATPGSHDANLGDASASAPAGGTSGAASCPLSLEHEKATSSNPDAKVMSSSEGRRGPSQSRIRSWAEGMQNDHMPDRLPQSHGLDHVPSTLDQRDLELYPPAWTTITNDMHLILHLLALYKGRSDDPMAGISARRGWKWLWTEN
ncbi:hypothetical protein FOVSG1_006191 [Fusarium oxysporum f. sp. vasinfectum]